MSYLNSKIEVFLNAIRQLSSMVDDIYIYGGGLYGQNIYTILEKRNIHVKGFVVTSGADNQKAKLPIINIDEVLHQRIGLIIGMNPHNARKAKEYLNKYSFDMSRVIDGGSYLDQTEQRDNEDDIPRLEVTTKMGCKINCRYCPQNVVLRKYYASDKQRAEFMSLENFETCLTKLPLDCVISFGGMSEAFLNPDCIKMIKMACESGRRVEVLTTLVGTTMQDVNDLLKLPISFVILHVADKYQYANIPVTDEYLNKLELIINAKKPDGTPFVNLCNAQGQPDEKVLKILGEGYEVLTSLQDRAGNLNDEMLISRKTPKGEVSCTRCGQQLNNNMLLPDGTVLLCCMDYGMKHVLGNLLQNTYEEILCGTCMQYVKQGMKGDTEIDILCRQCSFANLVEAGI